jgi:diguanylate cyclase (GGDEF)-like protein
MAEKEPLAESPLADGKLQVQLLANRWVLTVLYIVLSLGGVIDADGLWLVISATFLVVYHACYSWYTWHELVRPSFPIEASYPVPFLDTTAVSLALIAVGDAQHPIWGAYFFVVVGVAFFYPAVILPFTGWLALNYAMIGVALELRGADPNVPYMIVAAIILAMAMLVLATFTSGERRVRSRIAVAARTDPLTGAQNRRGLEESLETFVASARGAGRTLAVLMIDVDRFKRYNDQYGHILADGILEQLIDPLTSSLPDEHLVARYGGDEFVILVPGLAGDDPLRLAERLRRQVARSGLCTVSIGLSVFEGGNVSGATLLNEADAALLEAKRAGRDCVRMAPSREQRAA